MLNTAPLRLLLPACAAMLLISCDRAEEGPTNVAAMKDLEVVDGTTSDAMTDLDGVRAEGTAVAPIAGAANGSAAGPIDKAENATPEAQNAEVVSDQ